MVLSDYYFSRSYSTDDVEKTPAKFYNSALKEAIIYKRIAGYFSSASFAIVSNGLKTFIENGGKMQFIFNVQLDEADYDNLLIGYDTPETIIESRFLDDLSDFENECIQNHAKVLGWLIAQKILEVTHTSTGKLRLTTDHRYFFPAESPQSLLKPWLQWLYFA